MMLEDPLYLQSEIYFNKILFLLRKFMFFFKESLRSGEPSVAKWLKYDIKILDGLQLIIKISCIKEENKWVISF